MHSLNILADLYISDKLDYYFARIIKQFFLSLLDALLSKTFVKPLVNTSHTETNTTV